MSPTNCHCSISLYLLFSYPCVRGWRESNPRQTARQAVTLPLSYIPSYFTLLSRYLRSGKLGLRASASYPSLRILFSRDSIYYFNSFIIYKRARARAALLALHFLLFRTSSSFSFVFLRHVPSKSICGTFFRLFPLSPSSPDDHFSFSFLHVFDLRILQFPFIQIFIKKNSDIFFCLSEKTCLLKFPNFVSKTHFLKGRVSSLSTISRPKKHTFSTCVSLYTHGQKRAHVPTFFSDFFSFKRSQLSIYI
jgi:hypothetical protein